MDICCKKEYNDWVKKYEVEYEVESTRQRGRPKNSNFLEFVQKHCQAHKLNREDADKGWLMIRIGVGG